MRHDNVILFAYYYVPDNTSGVQRAVRLEKFLPSVGYQVEVICSSHAGIRNDLPNIHHVPREGAAEPSKIGVQIAKGLQRAAPYNEQIPWVPHAVACAARIISERPVAALISTSPPLATHLSALMIRKRFGTRWIADFRDPVLGNPGRARRWARPYDAILEKLIFANADAIVAVSDVVADEWRRRYPQWAHKVKLIWNGYDPDEVPDAEENPAVKPRVIAHIGVLYALRHPLSLLSAFHELVRSGKLDPGEWHLCFTGLVQDEAGLRSHPSCAALIDTGFLEINNHLIPRKEALRATASADTLLLLDINNLSSVGYTVPGKLYDYIVAGRPILASTDRNSPTERILQKSGIPHTCLYHSDSIGDLSAKTLDFLSLPMKRYEPSPWFAANFDGSRQMELWDMVLRAGH